MYPTPIYSLRHAAWALFTAPFVLLVLYPLVARNYRRRARFLESDRWYWADVLMIRCGWAMHAPPR